jgi:hypothetical protein
VLLSGRGEEEARRAERSVQESGADVTVAALTDDRHTGEVYELLTGPV